MKAIANRLRELRSSVGLSQNKIAKMVGVPQGSINRYEHDTSNPTPETLLWYADYFDVSLDYIYGRTDNPKGTSYENKPKYNHEMEKFIKMCFEPNTNANLKLKEMLLKLLSEGSDANE